MERIRKGEGATDAAAIAAARAPTPTRLISHARIRLFSRLVLKSQYSTSCLLAGTENASDSWLAALLQDVSWRSHSCEVLWHMRDASLAAWWAQIAAHPPIFLAKVSKALRLLVDGIGSAPDASPSEGGQPAAPCGLP